jgi:hypothetical protein
VWKVKGARLGSQYGDFVQGCKNKKRRGWIAIRARMGRSSAALQFEKGRTKLVCGSRRQGRFGEQRKPLGLAASAAEVDFVKEERRSNHGSGQTVLRAAEGA